MKKLKRLMLFRPLIRSRHPSHDILRAVNKQIQLLPYKSVIRLGSSNDDPDTIANGGNRLEINTVASIKISANKLLMKQKFVEANVKTADWVKLIANEQVNINNLLNWCNNKYPVVAKAHYGSKGKGNTLIRSQEELNEWMVGKNLSNYIFEKYMAYALEYRLHITKNGCFYTCRKALKADAPEDQRWRRHDDICVWLLEDNPEFRKPNSWNDIETDCVNALNTIGADILSFDVKVQSETDGDGRIRPYQNYILLECNSASSMGVNNEGVSICAQKYIDIIPKVIIEKAKECGIYKI